MLLEALLLTSGIIGYTNGYCKLLKLLLKVLSVPETILKLFDVALIIGIGQSYNYIGVYLAVLAVYLILPKLK